MLSTDVKPIGCLEETLFDGVRPQEDVIDALRLVGDGGEKFIISPGVAITGGYIALGSSPVSVSAPWGDEGG